MPTRSCCQWWEPACRLFASYFSCISFKLVKTCQKPEVSFMCSWLVTVADQAVPSWSSLSSLAEQKQKGIYVLQGTQKSIDYAFCIFVSKHSLLNLGNKGPFLHLKTMLPRICPSSITQRQRWSWWSLCWAKVFNTTAAYFSSTLERWDNSLLQSYLPAVRSRESLCGQNTSAKTSARPFLGPVWPLGQCASL